AGRVPDLAIVRTIDPLAIGRKIALEHVDTDGNFGAGRAAAHVRRHERRADQYRQSETAGHHGRDQFRRTDPGYIHSFPPRIEPELASPGSRESPGQSRGP